jgi:pimeloyl-ACP methyl ester carboxylesterase
MVTLLVSLFNASALATRPVSISLGNNGRAIAECACACWTGPASGQQALPERRIVNRGRAISIEILAEGRGPVIVFLPSRGRGADDYDVVAHRVAAGGFRVIRPQPRGIGRSSGPLDGLTLHDYAADVAAVIESESGVPVIVVGHAFGNWVARTLAADSPHLVKALVLAAAATGRTSDVEPAIRAAVDTSADTHAPIAERLKALELAFFAPGHDPKAWLDGWNTQTSLSQRAATAATPVDDWFAGGTAPILDLQAEFDAFRRPAFSNALRDALGERVTIRVIRNAGHALVPEQPEEFARAILDYARAR